KRNVLAKRNQVALVIGLADARLAVDAIDNGRRVKVRETIGPRLAAGQAGDQHTIAETPAKGRHEIRVLKDEEVHDGDRALGPDHDRVGVVVAGLATGVEITLQHTPFLVGTVLPLLGLAEAGVRHTYDRLRAGQLNWCGRDVLHAPAPSHADGE